eukprot:5993294-Pleurochrysis_carterae.AAC.3
MVRGPGESDTSCTDSSDHEPWRYGGKERNGVEHHHTPPRERGKGLPAKFKPSGLNLDGDPELSDWLVPRAVSLTDSYLLVRISKATDSGGRRCQFPPIPRSRRSRKSGTSEATVPFGTEADGASSPCRPGRNLDRLNGKRSERVRTFWYGPPSLRAPR